MLITDVLAAGISYLTSTETIAIVVGIIIAAVLVVIAVMRHVRKQPIPEHESCGKCGSVNVNHRAGLAVCMDCGHSVHLAKA